MAEAYSWSAATRNRNQLYYFRFRKFKVEGPKVFVYLDNVPMYAKNPTRMAFGGGFTVEFQKKDGKWAGEINESWIV